MRKIQAILIILVLACGMPLKAQVLSDKATISLLSCSPGEAFYLHFGHSAIRIQDPAYLAPGESTPSPIDWTFNYGIFDFGVDHFYWKFAKGETDYMLGVEYTSRFLRSSAYAGRQVYFQPLILDQEQKQQIFDALYENYKPENRYYRYNFVYDNCASRPWKIIKKTLDLPDPEGMAGISWRKNIDHFSGKWTWGKFGINLGFGYKADEEMTLEQSLFLPENLMNYMSAQGLTEDEYIANFETRDGCFGSSPELLMMLFFLLIAGVTAWDMFRKKHTWQIDAAFYILYSILGIVLTFLFFFSTHPFFDCNLNVLFLNPLWLVPTISIFFETGRKWILKLSPWFMGYLIVVTATMLVYGQTLHLMLALVMLHTIRLFMLKKQ